MRQEDFMDCLLRLPSVMGVTGLKRAKLYDLVKKGNFPAPYDLTGDGSGRSVGWLESEVAAWIAARINAGPMKSVLRSTQPEQAATQPAVTGRRRFRAVRVPAGHLQAC